MELLPCPFCGGKATFDHDDNGWYWIVCEKCGTATNSRTHTMEDCHPLLAEQWNRRASPASATEGWKSLTDVQWMNIVNLNHAWANVDKEDAINEVVKLVEAKCKENNLSLPNLASPALNRIKAETYREAAEIAGPEDSYQDQWFKAKSDSCAKLRAKADELEKSK